MSVNIIVEGIPITIISIQRTSDLFLFLLYLIVSFDIARSLLYWIVCGNTAKFEA